jgi:hypothetical protein
MIICNVTPCSFVDTFQHIGVTFWPNFQCRKFKLQVPSKLRYLSANIQGVMLQKRIILKICFYFTLSCSPPILQDYKSTNISIRHKVKISLKSVIRLEELRIEPRCSTDDLTQ